MCEMYQFKSLKEVEEEIHQTEDLELAVINAAWRKLKIQRSRKINEAANKIESIEELKEYIKKYNETLQASITISTEDKLEYNFYPVTNNQVQFRIRARNDAHIALTTGPYEGEPMYEVFIGGWRNTKSIIRKNRSKPEVAENYTPNIVSGDEFRGFWIRWNETQITVGRENESKPILSYIESEPLNITHFGVCTGWGASGDWIIEGVEDEDFGTNIDTDSDDCNHQTDPDSD